MRVCPKNTIFIVDYLKPAAALFMLSCLAISSLKLEFPSTLTP